MKFKSMHPWDLSPVQAINIQKELRQSLESKKWVGMPRLIAGVDVAFRKDLARGAVVVLDYPELKIICSFSCFPLSVICGKIGLILHRLFSSNKRFICSELIAAGFYKEGDYLFNKPQQDVLPANFDNPALFEEVKDI